jgi:hypothetical protein
VPPTSKRIALRASFASPPGRTGTSLNSWEKISSFLRTPWAAQEQLAIDEALVRLQEKLSRLEGRAASGELNLNWAALDLARSYASNTLNTKPEELPHWQGALRHSAVAAESQEALSLSLIEGWNRILRGNVEGPVIRSVNQSLVGRKLLSVTEVSGALRDFEEHVLHVSGEHAVVRASRIYQWLISIHPFTNANGRTARIAADYVLIEAGYLPTVFPSPLSFSVALFPDRPRQIKPIEAFWGTVLAIERAADVLCL